mmetsp:Transcript_34906/g.83455  ORF Transcript_34906/g.83455 Transcript_34906/m.83455 type:complete len:256 (-) Transcript_34906:536-1303(-)
MMMESSDDHKQLLELEDGSMASPLLVSSPIETQVESTLNPDGSFSIKASTCTSHTNANGYRDVKVEHYHVPSHAAKDLMSRQSGVPDRSYLSRVEYKILQPGHDLDPPDDDVSTVYSYTPVMDDGGSVYTTSTVHTSNRRSRRYRSRTSRRISPLGIVAIGAMLLIAILIGAAIMSDDSNRIESSSSSEGDEGKDGADDKGSAAVDPVPDTKPAQPDGGEEGGGKAEEQDDEEIIPYDNSTTAPNASLAVLLDLN